MRLASWIVATHFRPDLLRAALASIADNTYPAGWHAEVLVVHHVRDSTAASVVAGWSDLGLPCRALESRQETGGGKRSAALRVATGDLVLVADDDDCSSSARAAAAITAFEAGHQISETREFRYLHLATGNVTRWCGRGDHAHAPVTVGTARNYKRTLLTRTGGWRALPRLIEKDLHARIVSRHPGKTSRVRDLSDELADTTVCLQHGTNVWPDRPDLAKGAELYRGAFRLVGEGHWSQAPGFPAVVAARLGLS